MTSFNRNHLLKTLSLNIVTLVVMLEQTNWVWGMVTIQFVARRETGFFINFMKLSEVNLDLGTQNPLQTAMQSLAISLTLLECLMEGILYSLFYPIGSRCQSYAGHYARLISEISKSPAALKKRTKILRSLRWAAGILVSQVFICIGAASHGEQRHNPSTALTNQVSQG